MVVLIKKELLKILILSFLMIHRLAFADVSFTPWNPNKVNAPGELFIYREIKAGDYDKAVVINAAEGPISVRLNSLGGDVDEAMRIGKLIRNNQLGAYIKSNDKCVSACVLILAGATNRWPIGQVVIHRPYLIVPTGSTVEEQKLIYAEIEVKIKSYLKSMHIQENLYEAMFRVPPEKVRYLSEKELQDFGIGEHDPYVTEANQAKMAELLGINRVQLMQYTQCLIKENDIDRIKCIDDVLRTGSKKYPK